MLNPTIPAAVPTVNAPEVDHARVRALLDDLRRELHCEVLDDAVSLGLYATDASFYQIWPLAVVVPRTRDDIVRAVRLAARHGVPVLPRGGGTSLAGQTVNRALVIDVSKHLTRMLELNAAEGWARIEPGIVRDEFNALLRPHKLQYAPDPASGNRANVGAMIATNAAGMHSIRYGMSIDHIVGLEVVLSTGEVLSLGELDVPAWDAKSRLPDREGEIYRGVRAILERERDEILARYPKVKRRSGGYALDAFTGPWPWNLAKLFGGSEGTLGFILEARVRVVPLPSYTAMCVAHFASLEEALRAVSPIVAHGPSAVELIDHVIIGMARGNLLTRQLCGFIQGDPQAFLMIEDQGDDPAEVRARLGRIVEDLRARGLGYAFPLMLDEAAQLDVWTMRKNGEALMNTVKGDRKPVGFIEDAAVPLEVLPEYIADVRAICRRHNHPVSMYAHASVGLLHVRPMLDLHQESDRAQMKQLAEEIFERVVHYKGAFSGEHGDGIVRGGFNERFFGTRIYQAFREIKQLFDPLGLMNPGKILDTPPMDQVQRYFPGYGNRIERSMFHYRMEHGLRGAVEECTGVGVCRKTLNGTMCPSYIATRDEAHSTRGRANALRLAMTGQLGEPTFAHEGVLGVLDLCLSCKGCKKECPNNVDMAKLKAEALHAHHERHGSTMRDRMFRDARRSAALAAGPQAPLVNAVMKAAPLRWALDRFVGIERRRALPEYAAEPLSRWFARRRGGQTHASASSTGQGSGNGAAAPRPRVVLFDDTYIEYYETSVGRAAVEVLEAAGFEVVLANAGCCQRPAISKGFLDVAKREGTRTMARLDEYARQGLPILVCEPSCASALMDDLPDLIDDAELGARVAGQVWLIEQFIEAELAAGRITLPWKKTVSAPGDEKAPGSATASPATLVHGHCHQKALFSATATRGALGRIPGAEVRELDSGCCGMAGSFGYEKEHYELSLKVGEDRLFPALREAPAETQVVACGFSCRHQIAEATGRRARHAIEVIREAIED